MYISKEYQNTFCREYYLILNNSELHGQTYQLKHTEQEKHFLPETKCFFFTSRKTDKNEFWDNAPQENHIHDG